MNRRRFAARPLAGLLRGNGPQRAWGLCVLAGVIVAMFSRLPGPSPFFTVDKLAYLVWIPLALLTIWFIYRVARGWMALNEGRPMYR